MLKIQHKIKIIALVSIFFMVAAVINFSEPVAAAKDVGFKVDQGTKYFYDGQSGAQKMTWKTYLYYPSLKRKVVKTFYIKIKGKYVRDDRMSYILKHTTRTKMKITQYYYDLDGNLCTNIMYKKTKLSTRWYYWLVFRKQMMKDPYAPY